MALSPERRRAAVRYAALLLCGLSLATGLFAQTASSQPSPDSFDWLRYAPVRLRLALPQRIVPLDHSLVVETAARELARGLSAMTGRPYAVSNLAGESSRSGSEILLGTVPEVKAALPDWQAPPLRLDGYAVEAARLDGHPVWAVAGHTLRGVLYGSFALLEELGERPGRRSIHSISSPSAPIRWVDQWDNLDGSIERGYGGRSLFFVDGHVRANLTRAGEYARLLASLGLNGCNVNNVNASPRMLSDQNLAGLARLAAVFRPWGVRLALSVDLASPVLLGDLPDYNPKDPRVIDWWRNRVQAIYRAIPDFAGFTVKAGAEGEPGPGRYGLTPVAEANMLARLLAPYGGVVLYRAFVYNDHLNWRDPKADRAKAAYEVFHPLDGRFAPNVVIQIKNGPIDFQVREPASPLLAGLRHTNEAIELEVTQEYTGQARQTVYLVPMWKTVLDFNMQAEGAQGRSTTVASIVEGRAFERPLGGFVGVANAGLDPDWMGNPLSMANLWGYGRLAWNPELSAPTITANWIRLTFGQNPKIRAVLGRILLSSWRMYEDYTGPFGLGTLTDITGAHYGPDPQSAERNGWGQWFRATHLGVGMDRTTATGTGFIGQYPPRVAALYESLSRCPDNLLLFMHHVSYTYRMHSGKTVIQAIYDAHYAGAARAEQNLKAWERLHGLVAPALYQQILAIEQYQADYAIVWRDAITRYFHRMSGIPDDKGRVGHYPDRIPGATMQLTGYTSIPVTPWEATSDGVVEVCLHQSVCRASAVLGRPAGVYDIGVEYFDLPQGVSTFRLLLDSPAWVARKAADSRLLAEWRAEAHLPGGQINDDTAMRHWVRGVTLVPGDRLTLVGNPQGREPAPFDYLVLRPEGHKTAKARQTRVR